MTPATILPAAGKPATEPEPCTMDYFISTELGDDANPGTQEEPWQTLARANREYYKGDRVLLRCAEIYSGNFDLSEQNVYNDHDSLTIGAYFNHTADLPAKRPIIDAGGDSAITLRNVFGVTVRDLELRGSGHATNCGFGLLALNDTVNGKRLNGLQIEHVTASGFRWAGIYVGGIPNDLPGFDAPPECRYGFTDVSITDCDAHGNGYFGIYVSGPLRPDMTEYANANVVIAHCKAYDNPGDAAYTANHSGSGILLDNCRVGRIEHCEAWNNGGENGGLTGGPCGIWTHASDRVTIAHCKAYSNRTVGAHDGGGFDMDGGVTNSVIEHCESRDNDGAGYLVWNYADAPFELAANAIRDCVSENDGRKHAYGGLHIGTSGGRITDILVRNCRITQSPAASGTPSCVWVGGKRNENIVLRGNTFTVSVGVPEIVRENGAAGVTIAA